MLWPISTEKEKLGRAPDAAPGWTQEKEAWGRLGKERPMGSGGKV